MTYSFQCLFHNVIFQVGLDVDCITQQQQTITTTTTTTTIIIATIIIIIIIGVARFLLAVHPTLLLPVMLTSDDLFPVAILFTLSL